MRNKRFFEKRPISTYHKLLLEKKLLDKYYDFLKIIFTNREMVCHGYCQPSALSITYRYKIKYDGINFPRVYVVSPSITYDDDIHMYSQDHRLCLFYPKDFSWTQQSNLYNTIVPWTHEWFLFYEKYLISGKWEHPYVPHKTL